VQRGINIINNKFIQFVVLPEILSNLNCGFKCKSIWDGHGSWTKNTDTNVWYWKETIPATTETKKTEGGELNKGNRQNLLLGQIYNLFSFDTIKDLVSHDCRIQLQFPTILNLFRNSGPCFELQRKEVASNSLNRMLLKIKFLV